MAANPSSYLDFRDCRALIIDSNPTTRSILVGILRDMGFGHVAQATRILDARRLLENRTFDIVLCDYHFDHSTMSGQDLLDDLRRAHMLPYATVFVMVTSEASYAKVAEAAEAALDGYLLKPHSSQALEQRLLQARHRKMVLGGIFEAIERGEFDVAAHMCQKRFDERSEYWLFAARIGAELYIRSGNHQAAKDFYAAIVQAKALPWAKLGIARAELGAGQLPQAKRTLEALISAEPGYLDTYDVMGRVQVDSGDLRGALETFRIATAGTPHSLGRLQKQGLLAFYMNETDECQQLLERAVRIGIGSKMFDCHALVLLGFVYYDKRDTKALTRTYCNLRSQYERNPDSDRLRRFFLTLEIFKALIDRQVGDAVAKLRDLMNELRSEDFDFESASNALAALSRLRTTEVDLVDSERWIRAIGMRFCVSKITTEMLAKSLHGRDAYQSMLRECHTEVSNIAETAVENSVTGSPEEAVKALIAKGQETLNAKLIQIAGLVLKRHAEKMQDQRSLFRTIDELKQKFCIKGAQASLSLGGSGGREAGGLNLRV